MLTNPRILLIRTGGTIDAKAYPDPRHPPPHITPLATPESGVMQAVRRLPFGDRVDEYVWPPRREKRFIADSQEFSPDDIIELARLIEKDDHSLFLIIHGTSAMAKNAELLRHYLGETNKKIAFVGAMVPLSMTPKHKSDGIGNLHHALAGLSDEALPTGVQVLGWKEGEEHPRFFDPARVEKDEQISLQKSRLIFRER